MVDYVFLQITRDYMNIYSHFPLPVLICDAGFQVTWSNGAAKRHCKSLVVPQGLQEFLDSTLREEIWTSMKDKGSYTLRDSGGGMPDSDCLSFTPVLHQGEAAGAVVFCLSGEVLSTQGLGAANAETVSNGIRSAVSDLFDALETVATKADIMDMGWIKYGLNRVEVKSYGILRIASNLSEYARYAGDYLPEFTATSLPSLLEEMEPLVAELGTVAGVPITFQLPGEDLVVNLDIKRFEAAFLNLIHNSLSYSQDSNRITVTLSEREGMALVGVEDRGMGFPGDLSGTLVRPYASYRQEGKRVGAGLGLALARKAALLHGGEFTIRSVSGEGTAAVIALPLLSLAQPLLFAQDRMLTDGGKFSPIQVGLLDAVYP